MTNEERDIQCKLRVLQAMLAMLAVFLVGRSSFL